VTVGGPYSNVKCVKVELPGNLLPIANAGADFSVNEGQGAMLSGAGSSDPENGVLAYAWTQTGGPAVTLSGADTATPSFTAPAVTGNTPLTFELEVTDDAGQIDVDDVIVTVIDTSGGGGGEPIIGDNRVGGAWAPWTLFWLGAVALAVAGRRRRK
jgi:MYXO-CTERM domain-containing protein